MNLKVVLQLCSASGLTACVLFFLFFHARLRRRGEDGFRAKVAYIFVHVRDPSKGSIRRHEGSIKSPAASVECQIIVLAQTRMQAHPVTDRLPRCVFVRTMLFCHFHGCVTSRVRRRCACPTTARRSEAELQRNECASDNK
jgi:hypothetical protein